MSPSPVFFFLSLPILKLQIRLRYKLIRNLYNAMRKYDGDDETRARSTNGDPARAAK